MYPSISWLGHIVPLIYLMARRTPVFDVGPMKALRVDTVMYTCGQQAICFQTSSLHPSLRATLLNSGLSFLPCYSVYKSAGLYPSYSIVSLSYFAHSLDTHRRFKSRSEGRPASNLTPKYSDKFSYADLLNTPYPDSGLSAYSRFVKFVDKFNAKIA